MRLSSSLLLGFAGWTHGLTQQCSGGPANEGGNHFCGNVDHVLYEGLRGSGRYDAVAAMDSNGQCRFESKAYSGPLAPLDEGLSIHIRGPFHLKEAAVYTFSSQRKRSVALRRRAHGHRHHHRSSHQVQKRADMVTATINGVVVSWVNNYFGPSTKDPPPAAPVLPTPPPVAHAMGAPPQAARLYAGFSAAAHAPELPPVVQVLHRPRPGAPANRQPMYTSRTLLASPTAMPPEEERPSPTAFSSTSSMSREGPSADGDADVEEEPDPHRASTGSSGTHWDRIAYYDAESQAVENMMFMGNYGGQGSGVFDYFRGNSLAYLDADGVRGSDSPKILQDAQLPSNKEFAIFSAEKCDESCGFSRVRDIAYKGFVGANKVFLFRFSMPHDEGPGPNGDMPALWLLNARIPRTAQYNDCSCWRSKCGEADIFEVLAPGDTKCKSTLHVANGAGSSDWFARPVDGFVTVALVFHGESASISIRVLPSSTGFPTDLDDETVRGWIRETHDTGRSSLFQLAEPSA